MTTTGDYSMSRLHVFRCLLPGAAVILLGACSPLIKPGSWNLVTPDGQSTSVEVSLLRKGEYYLRAPGNPISGVYVLKEKRLLSMSKPDQPRMEGAVWQLQRGGELTLVAEPPFTVSGVRQTSATLRLR